MKLLISISFLALLAGCSPSTQLQRTWTDPSVTAETVKPFKKVLVIARLKDEVSDRTAEDKIVAQFKGNAVQSYSYLQAGDTVQSEVDRRLQKDGFDGLIVMKLIGVDKSLDVQSTGGYGGFYGRGYYGGGYYGGTTTVSENKTFLVETDIYSLATSKLMWSGTTSTLNPTNLDQSLNDIIAACKAQLVKQGLIKTDAESNPAKK